ncbi:hypothetical protein IOD14_44015 (plasmid) [Streptomyces sp. A2-16]|uniref:hypothetical protein n=1 Tax=Streptomyces sp. A2-16 TaxID=2781734 RepID=UPI001BB01C0F|nr:hypothetical protein [Streptomyces sp. A2-16]QUC63814.1 hypothetical protein IOD14_44015 [Streptomyces sp. A2-16]
MSKQKKGGFGTALRGGLATRGGGAQLPAQAAAGAPVELTPVERLEALEALIEASLSEYHTNLRRLQARHRVEVGQLLNEINEGELWRLKGHEDFGHYVKARWEWDRSYGYRLIDLAVVTRALAPLGPAVVDTLVESHARELAPIVKHNGDEAARNFVESVQREAGGKKVTATVYAARRDRQGLGASSAGQSPTGDEDEVVDAELVDEDEAEKAGVGIRAAANLAEKALRQLDEALALDVAPFHRDEASVDLSRIRTAAVRLQKRAEALPGA